MAVVFWLAFAASAQAACTNGSSTDCNPPGTTLNAAAAFVDPTPPAGFVQCAGFTNTPGDDVSWNWENNCIPFKNDPVFLRVIDSATGNILAGARLHTPVPLRFATGTGLNYRTDSFEGEGLLDNPSLRSDFPGTSLAWHEVDRSFCSCPRPGGGRGTCNDVFTANAANNKILYVGGNSSNQNYEAVYGPPGPKDTCSLVNENVRISIAIYAESLNEPFAAFDIEEAEVELEEDEANSDEFEVEGRFELGDNSDGIDPLNEEVIVTFAGFSQTIPAGSFIRDDDDEGFEFEVEGDVSGIKEIEIRDDGEFEVEGRGLDLGGIDFANPVPFSLQIGNDLGETEIPFAEEDEGEFEFEADDDDDDND